MAAAIQLATTTLSSQLRRQVWQGNERWIDCYRGKAGRLAL
jgi:hypothetical protein